MNIINGLVKKENMFEDLKDILSELDNVYTGDNNLDSDESLTAMEYVMGCAETIHLGVRKQLEYLINECYEFNKCHYKEFKFNITDIDDDSWFISLKVA